MSGGIERNALTQLAEQAESNPDGTNLIRLVEGRQPEHPVEFDERIQKEIGARLKELYDSVAHEPMPPRFADLLRKLANEEAGGTDEDQNQLS